MTLVVLLVVGALALASWELWRRRSAPGDDYSHDRVDPPPALLGNDADGDRSDGDGDGGGGGDA